MFIILPVGMNYRTERLPIVTFTLMGLNTLIYLVCLGFTAGKGEDATMWIYEHLWLIPAISSWHTFLTCMFVHAGFLHLLGNMFYLFLFGCCVEDLIGRGWFITMYLLGGILSALAYIAGSPEHFAGEIPMGGASGAISACMGAYLLLRTNVDIDFRYFGLLFFRFFSGEFSLAAWVVISFWFLKDLFFAGLSYYVGKGMGGVAFGAHVGGFLAGMAFIGVFKLFQKMRPAPASEPMRVHLPVRAVTAQPVASAPAFAQAAPVAMPTETPTLFLWDGQGQSGPFTLSQIQQMLALGSITTDFHYWSEGMSDWRSVAELAG